MKKKPNILMVIADQHNAGLMGCAGHAQALTPNLDRFAASGVRFSQAITQNTICTPSRVSLLSGQYCHNHGIYGLSGPAQPGLNNLMRHARQHGYLTAAVGKLHLPNRPRNWLADDLDRFGDTYETPDGIIGDSEYFRYLSDLGLRELEDSWHNPWEYGPETISFDARPSLLPYEHTQEVWCAREATRFMSESKEHPFCIKVSLQRPHHPLLPNERFWNLYPEDLDLPPTVSAEPSGRPEAFQIAWKRFHERKWDYSDLGAGWEAGARRVWRGTLACISQVDDVFGLLLDFLEENGLAENTIVIYGADHGAYHGIHGIEEKAPGICSEEVCRVPMIWRAPGVTPKGAVCSQLIENVDLAPTLTALCGLPPMDSVDGLDATPLLSGSRTPLHEIAVTENVYCKALRFGPWRYVHYPAHGAAGQAEFGELYNLESDPDERENLFFNPAHRATVERCRCLLLDWLIRTTRVVTTHPAVCTATGRMDGVERPGTPVKKEDPVRHEYPLAGDGKAPNTVQPRFRRDLPAAYL
jgi:arylsulfatase